MLQAIRDRAQGIFAWVMLLVVGIPFALWGIQNYIDTGTEKPAAMVGDKEILDKDVTRAYEQSLNNLVGLDDFDEKKLRKQALDGLISEEVFAQSAEKRSLAVTDNDARGFIQTLPYFQTDGKFDKDKYKVMLSAQGISPAQFAAQIRRALITQQFQAAVLDSAFVTKGEVETLMRLKNQERNIDYVKLAPVPVTKAFPDEEVNAYYSLHLADFRNPEKISVEYLVLDLDNLAKNIALNDQDLHKLYEEQKASFGIPERRKISHILIAKEGADDQADKVALDKAIAVRERITKGEDFAKLAQSNSADTVSAKKGGDLGFLQKDTQEESFTQAAEGLKAGDVSEPVKTSFGYHLIKVTELVPAKVKPFEEVKDEIRKTAQKNAAEKEFYDKGQKLAEQTFEHPDSLEVAAQQLGLKIQQTGLFTHDQGEGIAAEEAVRKAAFSEDVIGGRNSEPVELGNEKAVVLRVKEHQQSSDKPLTEVRELVLTRLRDLAAREEVVKRAKDLLKVTREGKPLVDAAKSLGMTPISAGFVRRENDKLAPELVRAAFSVGRPAPNKSTPGDVSVQDGTQFVFSVVGVKDGASTAADAKEQESANQFMIRTSGQQEFGIFVERLRQLADVEVTQKD